MFPMCDRTFLSNYDGSQDEGEWKEEAQRLDDGAGPAGVDEIHTAERDMDRIEPVRHVAGGTHNSDKQRRGSEPTRRPGSNPEKHERVRDGSQHVDPAGIGVIPAA